MNSLSKINIDDIQPGYTLGHADSAILRDELRELLAYREAQSEPVAWEVKGILCHTLEEASIYVGDPEPLYTAPQLPAVPDGWALVPIEITDDIAEAIAVEAQCCGGIAFDIYESILLAAPKPGGGNDI